MHTDITLALLDSETERLGAELRQFADVTCAAFDTEELNREVNARKRRKAKANADAASISQQNSSPEMPETGPKKKQYHLRTYKHHSLPDYVKSIRDFGTSDSFSTEPVSVIKIISVVVSLANIFNPHSQSSSTGSQSAVIPVPVVRNTFDN